ncbi:MAG: PilX N-terminal domain-containing pilus assembly protein [Methyloprofundus sp.]|nr:PilX N-terminal domain-containing pilus assembly protein [Methyloprofundus sp.]
MKSKSKKAFSSQNGAATLLTAVILLIATTLVAFMAGRTALQEVKMTANNYRAAQAIAAADAGMEYALAYFNGIGLPVAGLDHNGDGVADNMTKADFFTLTGINAEYTYDNNDGNCTSASSQKSALITVIGYSDDEIGTRTIRQCVGTRNLLKGSGPKQSLISGASVELTGPAQIINRYSDLNIWSANNTQISGAAMETYIRPVDMEIIDLTEAELIDATTTPSIPNVQKVSSGGLGSGTYIYQNDAFLAAAKAATTANIAAGGDGSDHPTYGTGTFFNLFFLESLTEMSEIADGIPTEGGTQLLSTGASDADLNGLGRVVFVDGDASMNTNGTIIGAINSPAIVIIDGDFNFSGGTIYGLVYITGNTTITGNPSVIGTTISEGTVSGTGTLKLVYARKVGDSTDGPPIIGTTGIISGSWRDW